MTKNPSHELFPDQPRFAVSAVKDLPLGSPRLRAAFRQMPTRFAGRDTPPLRVGVSEPRRS